jgi:hypothetical protein
MDPSKPSLREIIDRQIKQCLETGNRQELANILDDEVVIKRSKLLGILRRLLAKRLMCFATQ